jgi:glycosyltransferase involved in cell wall biosynthesis
VTDASAVWVVIPAFSEGRVIAGVVTGVRASFPNVIVVDDCSSDDTGALARAAGAIVLRHAINLGQGAALQTGIRFALQRGAAFVVTFDADGQHRVEDIAALCERQRETGADVVIGSRFLGSAPQIPALRRLMLRLAVVFTRLTTGMRLTDAHNGLRLLTRRAAQSIHLRQNRMAHASEFVEEIAAAHLAVVECPVTILYTEYSLHKGQRLSSAINILTDLFVARLHK